MAKKKKDVIEVPLMSRPFDSDCFYHSEKGSIACPDHRPFEGGDTWRLDGWRKMTLEDIGAYECKRGHGVACETCAAALRRAYGAAASGPEAVPTSDPAPQPEKKKGRRTKADLTLADLTLADLTLADLAERYVAHLEEAGKSAGTSASYGLELKTALAELGADTKLANLTPEEVLAYFASKRVTKKKNGKHKSPLSIAKTCRVLRLALNWAVEKKLIEKAPLPEALATH